MAASKGWWPILMQPVTQRQHIPVLLSETLEGLAVRPGGLYVDGTLGAGGHAGAILEASRPDGRVLAFDRDPAALALAGEQLAAYGERLVATHASFETMGRRAPALGFGALDGVLLDLGLSSMQLADDERGFSFRAGGALDMRFDPQADLTAADIVNGWDEGALAGLIAEYGEERHARRVARAIVAARPLADAQALVDVVAGAVGRSQERIHPATRTFQALRIAVNDELGALERTLPQALDLLKPGGRLAVISFHSLEDRIVKQFVRREAQDCICPPAQPVCTCDHRARLRPVTRKPVRASQAEVESNPRSRSARLRVAERVVE